MSMPTDESSTQHVPDASSLTSAGVTQEVDLPDIPPLAFEVPEAFHALPLAASAEERALLAEQFVRELYPRGEEDMWTAAAPYYAAIGEAMGGQGLAYAAMGLFAISEGVAHCSFTVAAMRTDHPSVETAANGIRTTLAHDDTNDVRWIDLPCGPAVSCVTLREITIDADLTADGQPATLRMGQVQVYLPFPTGPYTAVFTLDTAALNYWGEFSEMTMAILRTVTFASREAAEEQRS